jgi:hypothetical protein
MAYLRYTRTCAWYVFWERRAGQEPTTKQDEQLAVWHSNHRAIAPSFSYADVSAMLAAGDFLTIPGFLPADKEVICEALAEFVADVDAEYKAGDT